MAPYFDTLRWNLVLLLAPLGALAAAVLLWALGAAVADRIGVGADLRRAEEADALFALSYALRQEDMAVFQALMGESPALDPEVAARATDAAIAEAAALLAAHHEGGHEVALTTLATIGDGLEDRRISALAALPQPRERRQAILRRWRAFLDAAHADLEIVRHDLIRESGSPETRIAAVSALRHYTLLAVGSISANRFAIERRLVDPSPSGMDTTELAHASARLQGASILAEDQFLAEPGSPAFLQMGRVTDFLMSDYRDAEGRLLAALAEGNGSSGAASAWRLASREALGRLALAEADLAAEAQSRLDSDAAGADAAILIRLAAVALLAALLAHMGRLAMRRIILPMEALHLGLMRLGGGQGSAADQPTTGIVEIAAMQAMLARLAEADASARRDQGGHPAPPLSELRPDEMWATRPDHALQAGAKVQ